MNENVETLKNIEFSKKWVVVLSKQGTADIHEGLLGKIIISLPFEKKETADLICRCFNAHDILVQQRDDLLNAGEDVLSVFVGYVEGSIGGQTLKNLKAAIAKVS